MPLNLLNVVAEDLTYLETDWHEKVDDATLRRTSPVLRRLLVENDLTKAWRLVGNPGLPCLELPNLHQALTGIDVRRVVLAVAGGGLVHGIEVQCCFVAEADAVPPDRPDQPPPPASVPVKAAMQMPGLVVGGNWIPRKDVLQYVANKLGGNHYDEARDTAAKAEEIYRILDELYRTRNLGIDFHIGTETQGKDAIFYEVLSIGQALVKSPDARRLKQQLEDR